MAWALVDTGSRALSRRCWSRASAGMRSGGPQAEPGVHQEGGAARLPGHRANRGERCAAFFCIQLH